MSPESTLTAPDRKLESRSDLELAELIAELDHEAFTVLYERYSDEILLFLRRNTRDAELVDNAHAETFAIVWQRASQFRGGHRNSMRSWLFRIASRKLLSLLEKENGTVVVSAVQETGDWTETKLLRLLYGNMPSPVDAAIANERQDIVRAKMPSLRETDREILEMYELDGMSYEEIARALTIPVGTVKSRLSHARTRARLVFASANDAA